MNRLMGALLLMAVVALQIYADEPHDRMGLVNVSVACMRAEPRHGAEMVSQAIMGTPVRLLEHSGQWWHTESPDGYHGYIIGNSIVELTDSAYDAWRKSPRLVVTTTDEFRLRDTNGEVVTDVVHGAILEGEYCDSLLWLGCSLPDGRKATVSRQAVADIDSWSRSPLMAETMIGVARELIGVPYLWGGMSVKAMDCSGLVRIALWSVGRIAPRDAAPQAESGIVVSLNEALPGDLIFFGDSIGARVDHVGIYEGNGMFLHCSGRVRRNSLDVASPQYFGRQLLRVVRLNDGGSIRRVACHPWYYCTSFDTCTL
ncbi:MAG: C40 family peptidase [Muribaculaceae bacterium]|nr:C40 family peptidase [Muribaculaceae bacterium]